jgi:hypothetical protein
MAGAVRCLREAVGMIVLDHGEFPIREKHSGSAASQFRKDGWFYAVDLESPS